MAGRVRFELPTDEAELLIDIIACYYSDSLVLVDRSKRKETLDSLHHNLMNILDTIPSNWRPPDTAWWRKYRPEFFVND